MSRPKPPTDADLTDEEFSQETVAVTAALADLLGDHDPAFCACVLASAIATLARYTAAAYPDEWQANGGFDGWWTAFTACVVAAATADEQTEMRAVLAEAGI